jgi:adenylate kinase
MKKKLCIVIIGRSGCGKGTQARFIAQRLKPYGLYYFETGNFLRRAVKRRNLTTLRVKKILEQGDLVPGWAAAFFWLKAFIEQGAAEKHSVFDGSPRRLWDAQLIDEVMAWHERELSICLYIDVSAREAARRLILRGRKDDTPAAIQGRMRYFLRFVLPVVRYYGNSGRLIRIDGSHSPREVWTVLDKALKSKLGKQWPLPSRPKKR